MDNKLQMRRELVMSRMRAGRVQMQSYCLARKKAVGQGSSFSTSFLSGKNMTKLITLFSRHPKPIMVTAGVLVLAMLLPRKSSHRQAMRNDSMNFPQPTRFALLLKAVPYLMPVALRIIQAVKTQ